ncbi:hypothetical protein O4H26_08575 [Aequorivita viscosa]|nr:hypothetical protein [Aequorivita viscosa]
MNIDEHLKDYFYKTACDLSVILFKESNLYYNYFVNKQDDNNVVINSEGLRIRINWNKVRINLFENHKLVDFEKLLTEQKKILDCELNWNKKDRILHLIPKNKDEFMNNEWGMNLRANYFLVLIKIAIEYLITDESKD